VSCAQEMASAFTPGRKQLRGVMHRHGFCLYARAQTVESHCAQEMASAFMPGRKQSRVIVHRAWLLPLYQGANRCEPCTGDGFCLYARAQTVEGRCAQDMAYAFMPGRLKTADLVHIFSFLAQRLLNYNNCTLCKSDCLTINLFNNTCLRL